MALRISKIAVLFIIAANITIVVWNNLVDYNSNYIFISHVMSMDTTYPDNALMSRSVTSSFWWNFCYILVILTELIMAVICWIGFVKLIKNRKETSEVFNASKSFALYGLTLGLMLFGFVFITIAGEWFLMWQSIQWNGVQPALKMFIMSGVALIFISSKD
jgi:predicted small integral membrane protein